MHNIPTFYIYKTAISDHCKSFTKHQLINILLYDADSQRKPHQKHLRSVKNLLQSSYVAHPTCSAFHYQRITSTSKYNYCSALINCHLL